MHKFKIGERLFLADLKEAKSLLDGLAS